MSHLKNTTFFFGRGKKKEYLEERNHISKKEQSALVCLFIYFYPALFQAGFKMACSCLNS